LSLADTTHCTNTRFSYPQATSEHRAAGCVLQLFGPDLVLIKQWTLTADFIQAFDLSLSSPSPLYVCDDARDGGGWLLVRRVKQGSAWHPATDNLYGNDVYGPYGKATDDASFSIAFSSWVKQSTEFLFATGESAYYPPFMSCFLTPHRFFIYIFLGDGSKWMIAPFSSINNGGVLYSGVPRTITKSSHSSTTCTILSTWCATPNNSCSFVDTATWWWGATASRDPALFL
jgi:hypothetical protein